MGLFRWTSVATLALIAGGVATVADAQSNVCVDLQSRLVQLERGYGSGGNSRQYDGPIAQQKNEIDRASAEARRAGCLGGFLIFRPRPEAKCGKLMATINQMQVNLQRLMTERSQMGGDPFTLAQQRSEVLRALAFNRCGGYAANNGDDFGPRPGGLFETLFGQPRLRTFDDGPFSSDAGMSTYRTLCVRTCDGFYFPISFSTVPGQFDADAQTCQAMCPGAEAVLYTHRNPGEDVDQMVALDGQPYSSLPNAFKFRTSYDKTCTCHSATAAGPTTDGFATFLPDGTPEAAPASLAPPVPGPVASAPLPNLRPPRSEDPETIANRNANFVPRPVTQQDQSATPEATAVSADGRKIRVVGPAYYYGQ